MSNLFEMGQFGGFIWASYAVAALALVWMLVASWLRAKMLSNRLDAMMQDQPTDNSNLDDSADGNK